MREKFGVQSSFFKLFQWGAVRFLSAADCQYYSKINLSQFKQQFPRKSHLTFFPNCAVTYLRWHHGGKLIYCRLETAILYLSSFCLTQFMNELANCSDLKTQSALSLLITDWVRGLTDVNW